MLVKKTMPRDSSRLRCCLRVTAAYSGLSGCCLVDLHGQKQHTKLFWIETSSALLQFAHPQLQLATLGVMTLLRRALKPQEMHQTTDKRALQEERHDFDRLPETQQCP